MFQFIVPVCGLVVAISFSLMSDFSKIDKLNWFLCFFKCFYVTRKVYHNYITSLVSNSSYPHNSAVLVTEIINDTY